MKNRLPTRHAGFTLMELLLVVMIIGIVANMAIFSLSSTNDEVNAIKDRRNAQTIASVAATASAAGALFVVTGDVRASAVNLRTGATPGSGIFKGKEFKLPPMADKEFDGAINHLELRGSELMYKR